MTTRFVVHTAVAAAIAFAVTASLQAQSVTLPPDGNNPKASASLSIGLVEVSITYNSPKVTAPDGSDRKGKIWGQLVPYGMANLGFGTCGDQCPWRAGANENTVFSVSRDVKIEGQPLPAGSYGLFMIPGQDEWTIIFSKNSHLVGQLLLQGGGGPAPRQGQAGGRRVPPLADLRVHRPRASTRRRRRSSGSCSRCRGRSRSTTRSTSTCRTCATSCAPRRGSPGRRGSRRRGSASTGRSTSTKALAWAQNAVGLPFVGQENFTTLRTLADLQAANGLAAEADKSEQRALEHPTAGVLDLHQYGRQLITRGEKEKGLKVLELNAARHPGVWPVEVGLARGYAAVGRTGDALKHARIALQQAPDDVNRRSLEKMIQDLQAPGPSK